MNTYSILHQYKIDTTSIQEVAQMLLGKKIIKLKKYRNTKSNKININKTQNL